jgi:predicted nucleic acid-binding protein
VDDEESRAMADLEKIPNHGTIYLLFCFLRKAIITKEEFIYKLNEIIREGLRCFTELYIKIIKALDSF